MASDSNGSSMSSWQFMALLAAAMGAFLTSAKLGSPFPSAVEPASDKGILVDAHLADDPFGAWVRAARKSDSGGNVPPDRKSTRLNSSHLVISYAVFCLKKKIGRAHVSTSVTSSTRMPSSA